MLTWIKLLGKQRRSLSVRFTFGNTVTNEPCLYLAVKPLPPQIKRKMCLTCYTTVLLMCGNNIKSFQVEKYFCSKIIDFCLASMQDFKQRRKVYEHEQCQITDFLI